MRKRTFLLFSCLKCFWCLLFPFFGIFGCLCIDRKLILWTALIQNLISQKNSGLVILHVLIWDGELRSAPASRWNWTKKAFSAMRFLLCWPLMHPPSKPYPLIWMEIAFSGTSQPSPMVFNIFRLFPFHAFLSRSQGCLLGCFGNSR